VPNIIERLNTEAIELLNRPAFERRRQLNARSALNRAAIEPLNELRITNVELQIIQNENPERPQGIELLNARSALNP
jgi:hypothetical protein